MATTGNTILINVNGSGIGRGIAEAFHRLGTQVIIAGHRKQHLDTSHSLCNLCLREVSDQ
jgi:uncharacterized oxidoreductase